MSIINVAREFESELRRLHGRMDYPNHRSGSLELKVEAKIATSLTALAPPMRDDDILF